MDLLLLMVDFIVHIDSHLENIIAFAGYWTYGIVFMIIFAETGLVITPFLPGDSLVFALGALASQDHLNVFVIWLTCFIAAVLGDSLNYHIGKHIGRKAFSLNSRFIKLEYLQNTEHFYEKHGNKMIVLARFIPIMRTFAPFVAGIGHMNYRSFIGYNIFGAFIWTTLFVWLGFFFGGIPAVEHNFTLVIFGIIGVSLVPPIVEFVRSKMRKNKLSNKTDL